MADKFKRIKAKNCIDHPEECLKFYCTAHNDVICSICAVKRHKLCQDTLTFPEAIERFERERNNLFKALDNQSKTIDNSAAEKSEALQSLSPEARQIKYKVRNLRSILNKLIDKNESELLQRTEESEKHQNVLLTDDIKTLKELSVAAIKVKQKAEEAFSKKSELSVIKAMVNVQNTYCEIERTAREATERPNERLEFHVSEQVQKFIDTFDSLGKISCEAKSSGNEKGTDATDNSKDRHDLLYLNVALRENTSEESTSGTSGSYASKLPSSLDDIDSTSEDESNPSSDDILTSGDDNDVTIIQDNISKSMDLSEDTLTDALPGAEPLVDESTIIQNGPLIASLITVDHGRSCWLYGIAYMPDERIVVTDVAHDSLQLFDSGHRLLCETKVNFTPWDVAVMTKNSIAVCTGGKRTINTFSIHGNNFALLKSLDVGSDCISIAYSNNVFTAGTRRGGVLISEDGDIISRIEKNCGSREVFRRADFLAVDDDSKNIYISNAWASKIVCVTPDGRKLWENQTKGSNPRGLLWYKGRLIVASRNQHKVITVDKEGGFIDDLVTKGLEYPYAVAFHPVSKLLAVTQWDEKMTNTKSRTVRIYQL